jgi:hydrogenase maturation protein HypF
MTVRLRIRVRGVVQGVGFRPHVHALARRFGVAGWVRNDAEGVLIEAEGARPRIEAFCAALERDAPPLASVDAVECEAVTALASTPASESGGFAILESAGGRITTAIGPDVAVCAACLAEMRDTGDRRFGYPFLNCTHCGPRYTITRRLPYDRANTAMAGFELCPDCAREYADPADRRYHAQPTACPACGPRLAMPVAEIVRRLRRGEIVAIKGLGGFHLACDARDETAVARLRARKDREEKPLAVMVRDVAAARRLARVDEAEAMVLEGPARPIVLLRRPGAEAREDGVADGVAPGLAWLGIMLPYTPLHHLMFDAAPDAAWVMTSANPRGEPLVVDDAQAAERLDGIADAVAGHDRPIAVRVDDSVVRVVDGAPGIIRRARGYVPQSIRLPFAVPPLLAVGGHLKATVCVTRGSEAFLSQHIGDLDTVAAVRFLEETAAHLTNLLEVTPEAVAHDLHPDFASTRYAESLGLPTIAVQHHHAHAAAVMAEHGRTGPLLALCLDGFGLGADGGVWGGELLLVEGGAWRRLGHLRTLPQPGGEVAARQPWRMAVAALHRLGRTEEAMRLASPQNRLRDVLHLLDKGTACPESSSCGRLFDAACGLLGVQPTASFEGQAPMALEGLVRTPRVVDGGWRITGGVLDLLPLLDRLPGREARDGAELFHGTLIAALADWTARAASEAGVGEVALGGGCFLNHVLSQGLVAALRGRGLTPLVARQAPPNDGGLSLGQAWAAALQLRG